MKITDVRITTVTVPLKSTIRHCVGAHWGRIVRTIVEIETDEGITGLGEMGGGGESAQMAFENLKSYLIGESPLIWKDYVLKFVIQRRVYTTIGPSYMQRLNLLA